MEQNDEFIRVGTTYYKIVDQPLVNGETVKRRIPWSIEALRQDYGKNFIADIPKYDGFCTVPNHLDYNREVGTFYNLYEPITHQLEAGQFPRIKSLMEHIFGEQYELGMDYLQILYEKPTQKLPVLLLVSTERNTGKTSFLNFLKLIFLDNVTFNTNEDFRSQFNADWAGKLLILVDEVLLSRREDSERLKNLSTALTYKMEAKGKDRNEVQFFAKFVLCSNNESFPVIIDPEEIRYWVRKVEPLENDDPDFLRHLEAEIPHFLFHLKNERVLSTKKESRMWFNPALIHTEALDNIIRHNRPRAELDMVELCLDVMERNNLTQYCFCPNDIQALLLNTHVKIEKWQILKVLKERWQLQPAANAYRYTTYNIDYTNATNYMAVQRTGRYYTVQRDFLEPLRC